MDLKDYIYEAISSGRNSKSIGSGELNKGDKIRVKSYDELMEMLDSDHEYYQYVFKHNGKILHLVVNGQMLSLCGQVCTVKRTDSKTDPYIRIEESNWIWHPDLFERA